MIVNHTMTGAKTPHQQNIEEGYTHCDSYTTASVCVGGGGGGCKCVRERE